MSKHHGLLPFQNSEDLCHAGVMRSDRFGRMFTNLPDLYINPNHLAAIGDKNGPMKSTGPAKKTKNIAVAQVFFGQFVDHDITLDLTSSFARLDRAEDTTNFRTPTLDLDCIYGDGPEGSPFLYYNGQPDFNGVKMITGADAPGASALEQEDLVRSVHGTAIIGDPRNDENRIISQLQLGFIRFHNKVVDKLHTDGVSEHLFEEARRVVTWHYQWVVINDFLKAMVGQPLLDDILGCGRKLYQPEHCPHGEYFGEEPFIPVEFSVAAYRFGHSMIPQRIQVQPGKPALDVFGPSLGFGFSPISDPDAVVNWTQVLDLSDPKVDRADKLDSCMAKDLLDLPFVQNGEKSLVTRNLLRSQAFRLPSGEKVAEVCGRPQSEIDKVCKAAKTLAGKATPPASLDAGTPLWLYLLIEAGQVGQEVTPGNFEKGEGLGPVGGRIVAETIIGLMELDDHSYLGSNRAWSPATEEYNLGGVETLLDLLTF